jgi:PAS domain S-box-containing protein
MGSALAQNAFKHSALAVLDDHAAIFLLIHPATGTIVGANQAALHFYKYNALVGKKISDINILDSVQIAHKIKNTQKKGYAYFDFEHILGNGEVKNVAVFSGPIVVDSSQLLLSMVYDKSAEVRAKQLVSGIYKSVPGGLGIVKNRVFISANDYLQTITGYSLTELLGKEVRFLYATQQEYENVGKAYKIIEQEGITTIESRWVRKDGSHIWVLISLTFLDADNPDNGSVFSLIDITTQKTAELKKQKHTIWYITGMAVFIALLLVLISFLIVLIKQRKKMHKQLHIKTKELDTFFSSALDLLCIADVKGSFVRVNKEWENTLGYSTEELVGIPFMQFVHPDDVENTLEVLERLKKQESIRNFTNRYRTKDGSYRMIEWRSAPGNHYVYAAARDVTDRMHAEEAIRKSERKYKQLFENMIAGFALHQIIYDAKGDPVDYEFLEVNPAFEKLTGAVAADIVGKTVKTIMPDTEEYWIQTYGMVASTGKPIAYVNYSREIGRHFDVWAFSPAPHQFATVFVDITDRVKAEQIVKQKNKELEQIVYVTSHDLRSPLVNVEGYGRELEYAITEIKESLAKDSVLQNTLQKALPDMEESLGHIRNSTRQMDALLKGLLKLSRTGRASLHIEVIQMDEVVARLLSTMHFELEQIGANVQVDPLLKCMGDEVQVTQVLGNLLSNAIKYRDESRQCEIKISSVAKENTVEYWVEDNGIGIAEQHIPVIFDLFHRLNPTEKEGDGLGLALVRQIMGRLNGDIYVESKVHEGSRFVFVLPAERRGN